MESNNIIQVYFLNFYLLFHIDRERQRKDKEEIKEKDNYG